MQPAVAQADRWCSCAEQKLLVSKIKANISGECLLSHFCHCVRMFMDAHFVSFSTSFNISFYNLAINPHSRSPNHPVSAAAGSFSVLWLPPAGESLSVQSGICSLWTSVLTAVSQISQLLRLFDLFFMFFHFVYVYMNFFYKMHHMSTLHTVIIKSRPHVMILVWLPSTVFFQFLQTCG